MRGDRPWAQFMRIIHKLPSHSRFKSALILDPEWAEQALEILDAEDFKATVSAEGWTREQDTLALIADYLQSIRAVLIAANSKGGRGPHVHPLQRPTSAIEKARSSAAKKRHKERVRLLIPTEEE